MPDGITESALLVKLLMYRNAKSDCLALSRTPREDLVRNACRVTRVMVDRSAEKSSKNFEVLVRALREMAETRKWDQQANEGKRDNRAENAVTCFAARVTTVPLALAFPSPYAYVRVTYFIVHSLSSYCIVSCGFPCI